MTVRVPDELAAQLAARGGDLERRALEALALEEFRAGRLSKAELHQVLGFERLDEADGFLKDRGVFSESMLEECSSETRAQQAAAGKALAAEFRAFRRGRTLGGLKPRELIREGLR